MGLLRVGSVLGLIAAAGVADAGISSTLTVVNDYDFRGIAQSAHGPAPQPSLDWNDEVGRYLGIWGSKIDFGGNMPNLEIDLYGGFKKTLASGYGYDVGSVYYSYHAPSGGRYNYLEVYTGGSYRWFGAKVFYSPKFGYGRDISAWYAMSDVLYPLPAHFALLGHVGYSFGEYWDRAKRLGSAEPYMDWAAGATYLWRHFTFTAKWVDGRDFHQNDGTPHDIFSTASRAVVSVSTTLPWQPIGAH